MNLRERYVQTIERENGELKERIAVLEGNRVQAAALYELFVDWARRARVDVLSAQALTIELKKRGFRSTHSNFNWWVGIRLKKRA